jgi:hypothetical protein
LVEFPGLDVAKQYVGCRDTQHNDIQHNDTQLNGFYNYIINDSQHCPIRTECISRLNAVIKSVIMLNYIILIVIMLSVFTMLHDAEYRYAECSSSELRYADFYYNKC